MKIIKNDLILSFRSGNWEIREYGKTTLDKEGNEIDIKRLLGSYANLVPALKRFADLTNSAKDLNEYIEQLENLYNEIKKLENK